MLGILHEYHYQALEGDSYLYPSPLEENLVPKSFFYPNFSILLQGLSLQNQKHQLVSFNIHRTEMVQAAVQWESRFLPWHMK